LAVELEQAVALHEAVEGYSASLNSKAPAY